MDKMFCMGVAIGMVGGALIAVNSNKARTLIKKSQDEAIEKMNCLMDEKLKDFSSKSGSSAGSSSGMTDYNKDVAAD